MTSRRSLTFHFPGSALILFAICAAAVLVQSSTAADPLVVTVDVTQERHPISPLIYGVNYEGQGGIYTDLLKQPFEISADVVSDLNATIVRNGGNLGSRYNWQMDSTNHASDFYYESLTTDGTAVDDHRDSDVFIRVARGGGAEPSVTIPMIDWLSKVTANGDLLPSFSVAKYGAQDDSDPDHPDAGNGMKNGVPIINNDKNDASVPNSVAFEQGFVDYLKAHPSEYPPLKYFTLDNEPDLWSNTHADVVHPHAGFTNGKFDPNNEGDKSTAYATRFAQFAGMIKSRVPDALVLGPETSSYFGYIVSPFDRQFANNRDANGDQGAFSTYPQDGDLAGHYRTVTQANPDGEYMPWLLGQLHQAQGNGPRLLDYFTLHYYSEGVSLSLDVSPAMQAQRSSSTRLLWDETFTGTVDGSPDVNLQLIRRMHQWVDANYPGTKTGITEYNWGAENHINGATTLADVLGIFGREGLDLATAFPYPPAPDPNDVAHTGFTYSAFKMYRNYDGKKSTFGDMHVQLSPIPDPDNYGFYAAQRTSDNKLTVMLVNKGGSAQDVQINFANFSAGTTPQLWRITGATSAIQSLPADSATLTASQLSLTLPPQSVTLAVVPSANSAATTLGNIATRNRVETGDNALIGGFIVTGTQSKRVIIRAIGPSLNAIGLQDVLANPTLELHGPDGSVLDSNDNWQDSPNKQAIIDTGVAPTNDLESAIVATLPASPGGTNYTAIVRGANNGTGIGVVQVFDLDRTVDSKLANISTRSLVQTGDNVLFAGTIVLGDTAQKVIVRAIGPSLASFVSGAMADPTLELHDGNGGLLASNDNWRSDQQDEIIATGVAPTDDLESAIVTMLPANGAQYTAIVRGAGNTTGIAVVAYALQ